MSNQSICNICGANYEYIAGRWKCPACGAYKVEELSNEEVTLLYNAAQKLRLCDFNEAEIEYADIIEMFPKNPEGYWGRLLARYGIKYEEDFHGRKIPTCYATSIKSVFGDPDYEKAMSLFPEADRAYYKAQAEYIERVRKEWVEKASKEEPYDIFLCYKDSDLANGIDRTPDSIAVQDLYIHLTEQGYRVFYSRESLRDKVGEKYEPYIFNALSTAKVMLIYGSNPEYITSTWLKNEWTRYIKRIQTGEKRSDSLLVACDGFSPELLPNILSSRQCLDATKRNFYSDLDKVIKKAVTPEEKQKDTQHEGSNSEKKTNKKRGKKFIAISLAVLACFAILGMILDIIDGKETSSVKIPEHSITITAKEEIFNKNTTVTANKFTSGSKYIALVSAIESAESITVKNATVYDINCTEELSKEFTVSVAYTKVNANDEIKVFYVSDDTSTVTEYYCFFENGVVSFETNHLSYYIIVEISVPNTNQDGNDLGSGDNQNPESPTDPDDNDNNQDESGSNVCSHTETEVILGYSASCTATGLTDGKRCKNCGKTIVYQSPIPMADHIEVIDAAVAATCATTGLTEGKHCSVCDTIIVKQQTTAKTAHTYDDKYDESCNECNFIRDAECAHTETLIVSGYAASCTAKGLTNGERCKKCEETLVAQTEIPVKPHTKVVDAAVAATCTTTGLTEGKHCSVCNTIIIRQQTTVKTAHTEVVDVAVAATCTTTGLTEGKHCSVCNTIIIRQQTTQLISHTESAWLIDEAATKTEDGKKHTECTVCHEKIKEEVIPRGSVGLAYTVSGQECAITGIGTCTDTEVVLPLKIDGATVTSIGNYAFGHCSSLTSVDIPDSVKSIGVAAFWDCSSLTSIEITDGVTSIGDNAFYGCSSLESIVIGDSVKSIGRSTFYGCKSLTSTVIGDSVTSIGDSAFRGCLSLTSVEIPDSVTSIGDNVFYGCSSLTSIVIGDGVTSIGYDAFDDCSSIESIVIGDSIKSIGSFTFEDCSSLTSIVIGDGVKSIGNYAFDDCSKLKYAYYKGSQAEWANISIESYGNSNLTSATIYYYSETAPTVEGNFWHYNAQGEITVWPEHIDYPYSVGLKFTSNGDGTCSVSGIGTCSDINVIIPSEFEGMQVTKIDGRAFANNIYLRDITIPASVKAIGEGAFSECEYLTTVNISNGIESIGKRAFYKCYDAEITVPGSLKSVGEEAFYLCNEIKSVTLPSSLESIGAKAFAYCSNITSVTVKSGVKTIGERMFESCNSLKSVTIENGVETIGSGAFNACLNLKSVIIPGSVTSIGAGAFGLCKVLESITIPGSVKTIGNLAFAMCEALKTVIIGNGVESIGAEAFAYCIALKSITIPESVTFIGKQAFLHLQGSGYPPIATVIFEAPAGWHYTWQQDENTRIIFDVDTSTLSNSSSAASFVTTTQYETLFK